ncbi:unnamed protein product [Plutella xylostella]|uniref:(diamondback moth) hypothetical protein n=1 Tax=Plutella xylostella TaxID=51655 RepID=A0A8S4G2S7_PLUXY|nr:unnamed protein product [Plutella xylostella]
MSGPKKMTLRVQSAEGTARVEVAEEEATARLFEAVYEALGLASFGFALHRDRQRQQEITSSKSRLLRDYGLRHGDMLYLSPINGAVLFDQPSTSSADSKPFGEPVVEAGPSTAVRPSTSTPRLSSKAQIKEDDIDVELSKLDGKIQRERDDKLCRHNSRGCCVHCSPIEPWDEEYLKAHNIKHMSFHAYLRKLTSGQFISLDELSLKIKPGCAEHPPWPRGICSKCQPGAVTLTRQPYRHVDNVVIEHAALVERFLAYWRATGHQRIGYLYGQYEPHPTVPLGIRARVAAIYEPPQISSRDHIALQPDSKEEALEAIASALGLRRVGWCFTDLIHSSGNQVQCVRGMDTHFLSAQECIMGRAPAEQHPNPCRLASSGHFGSKFVTVCITGDKSQQVHMEGYQVSGQCQALVRDEVLLPTRDAPDLGYIRDSSDRQYVPDLYYSERDAYGNEVNVSAKRLPVAYLLVDVPVGSSTSPPLFSPRAAFPPAHRPLQSHLQSLQALHEHIENCDSFLEAMSDLHVLLYLASNEQLQVPMSELKQLLAAVAARDARAADEWRANCDAWAAIVDARNHSMETSGGAVWTCPHCTFHNPPQRDNCDMCALPSDWSNISSWILQLRNNLRLDLDDRSRPDPRLLTLWPSRKYAIGSGDEVALMLNLNYWS